MWSHPKLAHEILSLQPLLAEQGLSLPFAVAVVLEAAAALVFVFSSVAAALVAVPAAADAHCGMHDHLQLLLLQWMAVGWVPATMLRLERTAGFSRPPASSGDRELSAAWLPPLFEQSARPSSPVGHALLSFPSRAFRL